MDMLSKWSDHMEAIWAKSPGKNQLAGESLIAHTWEVLSRLRDLARLRPWLPDIINYPQLWHVLFWAAFFHDWGKVARGFQAMLRGQGVWGHRHEVLSILFVDWAADVLSETEVTAVVAAIVSHHKDLDELSHLYPAGLSWEDDPLTGLTAELDEADISCLWGWLIQAEDWSSILGFGELGVRFPEQLKSVDIAINDINQNGNQTIRQHLRSYRQMVREIRHKPQSPWILLGVILRGCLVESDHIGSAHAGSLPGLNLASENVLFPIGSKMDNLYQHQREALNTEGSAVLIAPTGSGKTEAALLWASRQVQYRRISRLFYTLPYQASMNAMYDRLNLVFPGQIGLLHGHSLLALYRRLMEQAYEPRQAMQEARRFHNLARLYYYPIQVFSPYQMLKAAFQLKGYEAILADFAGSGFIYDEIHAYDPRRLALFLEITAFLKGKMKACFFVMSATMPDIIKRRLYQALGQVTQIQASESLFEKYTRHEVHLLDGDLLCDDNLNHIKAYFEQGKSVLVTCNTVKRAQHAYRWLQNNLPSEATILVHSRFNSRDRLAQEQLIMAATGLNSQQRRPVVVVSTQVVEVSLNIDLDTLFSDPAPLEALVQRFGRINRSGRLGIAAVNVFKEPSDGQGVYLAALVKEAIVVLSKYADGRVFNERSLQKWLDEIYTGPILDKWEAEYQKVANEFRTVFIDNLRPFNTDRSLAEAFDRLFDGLEVLPACLEEEYRETYRLNPLEAAQLLVPIPWRSWHRIKTNQPVCSQPGWPPVVHLHYSPELGLDI